MHPLNTQRTLMEFKNKYKYRVGTLKTFPKAGEESNSLFFTKKSSEKKFFSWKCERFFQV